MTLDEARRRLAEHPDEAWSADDVGKLLIEAESEIRRLQTGYYNEPIVYGSGATTTPEWLRAVQVLHTRFPGLSMGMAEMSDDFNAPMESKDRLSDRKLFSSSDNSLALLSKRGES